MLTWKNVTVVIDEDEIEITTPQKKTFVIHIDEDKGSFVAGDSEQPVQRLADDTIENGLLKLV